jgi:hypothetical protein
MDHVLGYTNGGRLCPSPNPCIPMSTAISRVYTPEGFVIAADGRSLNKRGEKLSDSVRKIFGVEHPNRQLAFTACGDAGVTDLQGNVSFEYASEAVRVMDELSDSCPNSLWHFAVEVMDKLLPRIVGAKEAYKIFPDGYHVIESETVIFIDGYYNGDPDTARVRFRHYGAVGRETKGDVSTEMFRGEYECGSPRMIGMLQLEDAALAAFRPSHKKDNMALQEAITVAHNRVRAQRDPIAVELDQVCRGIGGHIHIATVTPAFGFAWVKGFEPIDLP